MCGIRSHTDIFLFGQIFPILQFCEMNLHFTISVNRDRWTYKKTRNVGLFKNSNTHSLDREKVSLPMN